MPRRSHKDIALTALNAAIARQEAAAALDPVAVYRPRETCTRCMNSEKLYRLLNGPNQVGKTNFAVWECAAMVRLIHPVKKSYGPVKILVVVPSRQQALAIWGKRLLETSEMPGDIGKHPFIPPGEIEKVWWNTSGNGKAPGRICLKNGSEIWFAWSGDEQMWKRIQGIMFDYVFRDEAVGSSSQLGPELYARVMAARDNPHKPWGGGVLWVGTPTIDSPEYEEYQRNCRESKKDYEEFFIQPDENPAVSMATRDAMRDTMSKEDAAVRLDGEASYADRLRIYRKQWNDERHLAKVDYEPGLEDNLWIAFDPGIGHEAGILCCAINHDAPDTIRVVQFYCHKNMPLSYHVQCMAEWLDGRHLEGLVVDPKAFTRESSGKSIVTQIEEYLASEQASFKVMRGILRGRNNHWDGINLVWQYLDPEPGNPLAPPKVIVNQLSPGCGLFRYQMTQYKGREETKYTGVNGVVKKKDEGPDCLRYLITKEPHYEARGANPRKGLNITSGLIPRPEEEADAISLSLMSPEQRLHHQRIQQSIRQMEALERESTGDLFGSGRQMSRGTLGW